jgi:anti-sigma factor RsiW
VRTLNPVKRHRERCREVRAQMSDYLDGELDRSAAAGVERHARWCPNCRRMLENLRRTVAGLGALRDLPTPADEPQG